MKTTEELIEHIGNILIELRKDPTKEFVPAILRHLLLQIKEAAKAERDEYWEEKIKEATRLRMACLCLKPDCFKEGWNQAMDDIVKALIAPNRIEYLKQFIDE